MLAVTETQWRTPATCRVPPTSQGSKGMWRKGVVAAILVVLPISAVAVGTLGWSVSQMFSPCVGWGGKPPATHGSCRQYSVDSQTRTQAALWAALLQGVILLAAVLGVWGTVRLRQIAVIFAGLLMFLEAVPLLFSAAPLAVLASFGLLVVAYRMENQTEFSNRAG